MSDRVALGPANLLRLHGADARSFAHAQFCSDVAALPVGDWQWSAWLDAKGRVRFFFALIDAGGDGLLAWLPLGDVEAFAIELRRFLFRAKVKVDIVEGWSLHGCLEVETTTQRLQLVQGGIHLQLDGLQPRRVELMPVPSIGTDADALARWRGCDVIDGLPLIDSACADEFVPQALDLERVGAISFRKGCYPGQEIAARLHFRGGNKRHLQRVRWPAGSAAMLTGTPLLGPEGSTTAGRLLYCGVDASGPIGLAVIADSEPGCEWTTTDAVSVSRMSATGVDDSPASTAD